MKKTGKNFTFIRDEDGDVIDVASLKAQEEAATTGPADEEPCKLATTMPHKPHTPVEAKKTGSAWKIRATRAALVAGWVLLGTGVFLAAVSILRDSGGKR